MLEYQDKKFGKVKLVTVTEARANFAALLQDKDTHYIITKNNKPTRVIVNYQAFEDLHKKASAMPPPPELKSEPKGKKSFEHLSGLLEERNKELKSQDVFVEDDRTENIIDVFESRSDSLEQKNEAEKEEDTVSEWVVEEKSAPSENYFESGDEGDEASILHPEHMEEVPLTLESLTPEPKEQKLSKTQKAATTQPDVVAETSFPSEADMTPEQKEYFQKYRKLYENPIPSPEVTADPLPYDDVTREVEKRLAAKWGKNEFKRTAEAATQASMTKTPMQNSRQAEDEFLAEPISEDPQDPDGLPSLKDLLKDLEQETLSGDDGNKENMEKGDIDELIHRITHDY